MTAANPTEATIDIVDSKPILQALLDTLSGLLTKLPSLYVDLEGIKLSRNGSISILTIYVQPKNTVYLVDVKSLGSTAFTTTSTDGSSTLKSMLESASIPKVFFDVRNDSDALYARFGIFLAGVVDLQLMQLATRNNFSLHANRKFIAGLSWCIENDLPHLPVDTLSVWKQSKADTTVLFDPKKGGRYEVFDERPMRKEIVKYCALDVVLLPHLYGVYELKLKPAGQSFWRSEVEMATKARVAVAKDPRYDPHAKSKAQGPWTFSYLEQAEEQWNDDVLSQAM